MSEIEVGQYFDEMADVYVHDDEVDEIGSWPLVDEFLDERASKGDRILEIGCGNGLLLEYVLEQTDITEAHGVDISREMLPEATDVRAHYVNASATNLPLPFERESFDFVVLSDVLHHLVGRNRSESKRKARAALAEATALLAEDGHLIVKDIYYESPVGPDELTSYVIFYGLKYANGLVALVDDQAEPGLLVSFYTREELLEMIRHAGTTIVNEAIEPKEQSSVPKRILVGESACIRLYARKK